MSAQKIPSIAPHNSHMIALLWATLPIENVKYSQISVLNFLAAHCDESWSMKITLSDLVLRVGGSKYSICTALSRLQSHGLITIVREQYADHVFGVNTYVINHDCFQEDSL